MLADHADRFDKGSVVIDKDEDMSLVNDVKSCYEQDLIDVEVTAKYDHDTNKGSYKLEIILLSKVRCGARGFFVVLRWSACPISLNQRGRFVHGITCIVAVTDAEKSYSSMICSFCLLSWAGYVGRVRGPSTWAGNLVHGGTDHLHLFFVVSHGRSKPPSVWSRHRTHTATTPPPPYI